MDQAFQMHSRLVSGDSPSDNLPATCYHCNQLLAANPWHFLNCNGRPPSGTTRCCTPSGLAEKAAAMAHMESRKLWSESRIRSDLIAYLGLLINTADLAIRLGHLRLRPGPRSWRRHITCSRSQ